MNASNAIGYHLSEDAPGPPSRRPGRNPVGPRTTSPVDSVSNADGLSRSPAALPLPPGRGSHGGVTLARPPAETFLGASPATRPAGGRASAWTGAPACTTASHH